MATFYWPTIVAGSVGPGSFPLLAPDGSAAAPSYSFSNSTGTGLYSPTTNQLGLSTNGVLRIAINDAGLIGLASSTVNASDMVNIGNANVANNGSTTSTQRGLDVLNICNSSATTSLVGINISTTSDAAAFTSTNRFYLRINNQALGAGSSVTHDQGINIAVPTRGGTSNAAISDSTTPVAGSYFIYSTSTNTSLLSGNLSINTAGKGIQIKEGSNARMGLATLVLGTVVVSTTAVTATSRIFLTAQTLGTITAPVGLAVSARTAATSFTILSGNLTDTSTIAWLICEPL